MNSIYSGCSKMIFGTVQRCATSTASVVSGARIGNALSFANEGTGTRVAIKAHAPAAQARNMHYLKCFDCSQSRNVSKQSSPFMLVASPSNKFTSQRVFTSWVFAKNSNLPNKVASSQRNKSSMVQAVPVLTRFLESNVLLNAGAVLSLGGFMMSDEMYLRLLSVSGSTCGIFYNLSRKPPLRNAALWGLVFVSVNTYHLYHLYLERTQDMTFHSDEMMLYTDHFKAWGVEVWQFKKLVKLDGCRFRKLKKGEVVVQSGKPLNDVLMVVKGEVGAEDPTQPSMSRPPLYTYRGDGTNGCVIGGTALVDTKVQNSNYPNRLVAMGNGTVVVKWDRKKLISVMESDKDIESAFLHALYVELIQGLRRDETAQELKKNRRNKLQRRAATRKTTAEMMSDALLEMERNVEQAIQNAVVCKKSNKSAKEGQVWLELNPADKKNIRLFTSENRITLAQRQSVLNRFGWSPEEWEDGGKLVESVKR